jgi:hypothetical protein
MLALPACAGAPPIAAIPSACSTLIPTSWHDPVPGAPLPAGKTVGDWVAFGDSQTAQLDKANGRTGDVLDIVARCEARDMAAVKRVGRRKLLGLF